MRLNKKGDIGMLIVDIIFGMLIVIMLFSFSFLFKTTVDAKYERIIGGIANEDDTVAVLSLLQTDYSGAKMSDQIVKFCSSENDLKKIFESFSSLPSIMITCPNNKEFKAGSNSCKASQKKKISLISEDSRLIRLEYC